MNPHYSDYPCDNCSDGIQTDDDGLRKCDAAMRGKCQRLQKYYEFERMKNCKSTAAIAAAIIITAVILLVMVAILAWVWI